MADRRYRAGVGPAGPAFATSADIKAPCRVTALAKARVQLWTYAVCSLLVNASGGRGSGDALRGCAYREESHGPVRSTRGALPVFPPRHTLPTGDDRLPQTDGHDPRRLGWISDLSAGARAGPTNGPNGVQHETGLKILADRHRPLLPHPLANPQDARGAGDAEPARRSPPMTTPPRGHHREVMRSQASSWRLPVNPIGGRRRAMGAPRFGSFLFGSLQGVPARVAPRRPARRSGRLGRPGAGVARPAPCAPGYRRWWVCGRCLRRSCCMRRWAARATSWWGRCRPPRRSRG